MDRTTVFNTTVAAAAHRQDERCVADEIHRNLHALAIFHPPTNDLKRLLGTDMFLKPNSAAFMHVFHFLFNILDVREFRRSFRWPCSDKQDESTFRTAAVALMNTLIERHKLPLEPVKMHSVVLPGGLKFMRIVFEFTAQAMRDTVAKHCPADDDKNNMHKELEECREYQANVKKYLQKLDVSLVTVKAAHQAIQTALDELGPELNGPSFAADWAAKLDDTYERQLLPAYRSIADFSQLCGRLADLVRSITTNQNKQCVSVNAAALKRCQEQLTEMLGDEMDDSVRQLCVNNEFDYANIVSVYEAMLPAIASGIAACHYRSIGADTAAAERQLLDQMTTEVASVKLASDSQLQRTEAYFEWAQQKYPPDTITAAMAASTTGVAPGAATTSSHASITEAGAAGDGVPVASSTVVVQLSMRSRFLCTPPMRLKSIQNANNPIMSNHLPWTFEQQPASAASTKVLSDTTGMLFNRPTTPLRLNQSKRSGPAAGNAGADNNALDMLTRVLDRCNIKADAQMRSSTLAANSSTIGAGSQLLQSPLVVGGNTRSVTATPKLLALKEARTITGSPQPTLPTVTEAARKTPTAFVLRQHRNTLSAANNSAGDFDFRHTSPSGRFVFADSALPTVTVTVEEPTRLPPSLPSHELHAEAAVELAVSPDASSTGGNSQSSIVAARKIVFSPDGADAHTEDAAAGTGDVNRTPRSVLQPTATPFSIMSPDFGGESLANVSDSVLQYSPM